MTERVSSVEECAAAFLTLADAEGGAVPMYARLCRTIAADRGLAGLLLAAPTGQRLPVLVLAALHDLVLEQPDVELAAWFPSVGGRADHEGDLAGALRATMAAHRDRLEDRVRHRRVQTNEVNRCIAWRAAMASAAPGGGRALALVELGASAGLNLALDRYRMTFDGSGVEQPLGPAQATVELGTEVRSGRWPELTRELPPVGARVGLDQHPLDPSDDADARWLLACVWPEQSARLARLRAALALAERDPPQVRRGDLVTDLAEVLDALPDELHVVVLSSWTLAYVARPQRAEVLEALRAAARRRRAGGGLTLLTLEADHLLPWLDPPPLPDDAPAEVRHASLLAVTAIDPDGVVATTPLARCQAHLAWIDRLTPEPAATS